MQRHLQRFQPLNHLLKEARNLIVKIGTQAADKNKVVQSVRPGKDLMEFKGNQNKEKNS
jgi:hypothetical protein